MSIDAVEAGLQGGETATGEEKGQNSNPAARRAQRRLKPAEIDRLLLAYLAGDLVREIALRFGVSRTTVFGHVSRRGLARRSDDGWTDAQLEAAADLYDSGASLATVGHQFGVGPATVRNRLKRAGLSVRTRRGWT